MLTLSGPDPRSIASAIGITVMDRGSVVVGDGLEPVAPVLGY